MPARDTPHPERSNTVPVYQEYFNPILTVLREHGATMTIEMMERKVEALMGLAPELLAIPHGDAKPDGQSEVGYRMAWARTYLKKAGLLENPSPGAWALTDKGRSSSPVDAYALAKVIAQEGKTSSRDSPDSDPSPLENDDDLVSAKVVPILAAELTAIRDRLAAEGTLLSKERVAGALQRFRERFGPEALGSLDGEALLLAMHARGNRDSLVHWLEFKDDDEFPARFGSISGGTALKFGLYQSAETREWMQAVGNKPVRIALEEAIKLARAQRDQLVACAMVLLNAQRTQSMDHSSLQRRLHEVAPELGVDSSWVHKYLALLFPETLEPFHGADHQRHHLRKMLKLAEDGRYVNARIFSGVAAQLGMSLLDLGDVLHQRNGHPHDYWRVGTTIDEVSQWPEMRDGGFIGVGWDKIKDLTGVAHTKEGREQVREYIAAAYPNIPAVLSRQAGELLRFVSGAQERDVVLAMEGMLVRGVGRIIGSYEYATGSAMPHRRRVEWLLLDEWKLPMAEGLQTTFAKLERQPTNLIELERRLLPSSTQLTTHSAKSESVRPLSQLAAPHKLIQRIESILNRKRQVILFGPPGTGKTHWAVQAARELAARRWFGSPDAQLTRGQQAELDRARAIEMCSFHPAYGYEDFIEGYRPQKGNGSVQFELRDGIFKRVCSRAAETPSKPFFLIVDEINRGDIPRIFGELLMLIEKRGTALTLPLSGSSFMVPDNLFVLGTMNTADRSIALLDVALRRRFGFVELLPDSGVLGNATVGDIPIGAWLDALNRRVVQHVGREARHLQVGHSYLMVENAPVRDLTRFIEIIRDDIVPLLEEYCYSDYEALERILGAGLVVGAEKRVRHELFEPDRHKDFTQALLSSFSELATTKRAIEAVATQNDPDVDSDGEHP